MGCFFFQALEFLEFSLGTKGRDLQVLCSVISSYVSFFLFYHRIKNRYQDLERVKFEKLPDAKILLFSNL